MWNAGHIQRAKKRIAELVKAVNYILEVRDARAPFATGAYEREKLFRGKKSVIILNKSDIADESVTEKWEEFYRKRGERIIITKKGDRSKKLLRMIFGEASNVRALIVGLPNVGKSSFTNRLKGRKSTRVGAVPGVTRGVQWIQINDNVRIIDTPGILYSELFSKELAAKLLLVGSIVVEKLEDWEIQELAFNILKRRYPGVVRDMAGEANSFDEFLELFGRKRGMILKGGSVDKERASHKFFHDVYNGKIGRLSFEEPEEVFEI